MKINIRNIRTKKKAICIKFRSNLSWRKLKGNGSSVFFVVKVVRC